jgi:hypothetical protein
MFLRGECALRIGFAPQYFNVDQAVAFSSNSLNQRFALSYTGGGWDLTANVIYDGSERRLALEIPFGCPLDDAQAEAQKAVRALATELAAIPVNTAK